MAKILLAKYENKQYTLVNAHQKKDKETWVTANIQPGVYILYVKCCWNSQLESTAAISSYGPSNLQFDKISKQDLGGNSFVENIFQNYVVQNPGQLKPYKHDPQIMSAHTFFIEKGFGYLYIKNDHHEDNKFESIITYTKTMGLKIRKPNKGNQLHPIIFSGEVFVAVFTLSHKGYSYELSEKII